MCFSIESVALPRTCKDSRLHNDTGRALREIAMGQVEDYVQAYHLRCVGACSGRPFG